MSKIRAMEQMCDELIDGSLALEDACSERRYTSMDEMLQSSWEELVIQFDPKTGGHVVRTACRPMAPVC